MKKDELLNYFDDLTRLAQSKCTSDADAEDLVSETFVAALTFLNRGGEIAYPKTWLANTFMHKYNSALRKKYGAPEIVSCDVLTEMSDWSNEMDEAGETDEEAELRREVTYLTQTNREAVIRYYFAGESVAQIAEAMGVPEGTVKSRLFQGRSQIRKGLDKMANITQIGGTDPITNTLPSTLRISNSGSWGNGMRPMSLVEGDLIAQNILINAYERPLTMVEIARVLGIPTAYIEPIVEKLVDGELMAKTSGDRYYTDCIVYKPEDSLTRFDAQLQFVDDNFDRFWKVLAEMLTKLSELDFYGKMNPRQQKKLERYAILDAVQSFVADGAEALYAPPGNHPKRKDGGQWTAMTWMYPAGFDFSKMDLIRAYNAVGGRRFGGRDEDYMGSRGLAMSEFETPFKDCANAKFSGVGLTMYSQKMRKMLWCIYKQIPLDTQGADIPQKMIEQIPEYEKDGILLREDGVLKVDIPTLSSVEYWQMLDPLVGETRDALIAELSGAYCDFLRNTRILLPEHLKGSPNVPDYLLYRCSNDCILMAVVRKACEKQLHLHDVDFCCPPMVFLYVE
ncbi:MAG: RNA polymerase sigma factor [Eubacteriales bacterium]